MTNTHVHQAARLPAVLAVLGVDDFGPCDGGQGSASCPHCGAEGRYVINFLCEDGTKRGAMKGCFKLFPGSNSRTSKLIQEAFERQRRAKEQGTKLAGWWEDIIGEVSAFSTYPGVPQFPLLAQRIDAIDARRRAWLTRNGYGRFGRRQ